MQAALKQVLYELSKCIENGVARDIIDFNIGNIITVTLNSIDKNILISKLIFTLDIDLLQMNEVNTNSSMIIKNFNEIEKNIFLILSSYIVRVLKLLGYKNIEIIRLPCYSNGMIMTVSDIYIVTYRFKSFIYNIFSIKYVEKQKITEEGDILVLKNENQMYLNSLNSKIFYKNKKKLYHDMFYICPNSRCPNKTCKVYLNQKYYEYLINEKFIVESESEKRICRTCKSTLVTVNENLKFIYTYAMVYKNRIYLATSSYRTPITSDILIGYFYRSSRGYKSFEILDSIILDKNIHKPYEIRDKT
ncbi:hypothetical protein HERIO_1934 [Hepatospora eriocheir]|uniref:Uncharacterized protein n=1 Tax=Hepatospora eriocheir TaxID=1081669 RepID=A0A1X0Q8T4_9MICR|nr:hypothetical protein HERIO_1934 [Hepatospora eriocheir]